MFLEEVLVFVEADGQKVEQISNIDIVRQRTKYYNKLISKEFFYQSIYFQIFCIFYITDKNKKIKWELSVKVA